MVVRKVWLSSISQTLMAPSADALLIVGGCVVVSAIRSFIACSFLGHRPGFCSQNTPCLWLRHVPCSRDGHPQSHRRPLPWPALNFNGAAHLGRATAQVL